MRRWIVRIFDVGSFNHLAAFSKSINIQIDGLNLNNKVLEQDDEQKLQN